MTLPKKLRPGILLFSLKMWNPPYIERIPHFPDHLQRLSSFTVIWPFNINGISRSLKKYIGPKCLILTGPKCPILTETSIDPNDRCHQVLSKIRMSRRQRKKPETLVRFKPFGQIVFRPNHAFIDMERKVGHH